MSDAVKEKLANAAVILAEAIAVLAREKSGGGLIRTPSDGAADGASPWPSVAAVEDEPAHQPGAAQTGSSSSPIMSTAEFFALSEDEQRAVLRRIVGCETQPQQNKPTSVGFERPVEPPAKPRARWGSLDPENVGYGADAHYPAKAEVPPGSNIVFAKKLYVAGVPGWLELKESNGDGRERFWIFSEAGERLTAKLGREAAEAALREFHETRRISV
jgi:hypothetical protein